MVLQLLVVGLYNTGADLVNLRERREKTGKARPPCSCFRQRGPALPHRTHATLFFALREEGGAFLTVYGQYERAWCCCQHEDIGKQAPKFIVGKVTWD